jgi:hypothetical protein
VPVWPAARILLLDQRLWPEFVAFDPGYEFFQRNATARTIPILILDPRS